MIIKKILFCFLAVLFITSCSIKKRTYRNGYYVDWTHKTPLRPKNQADTFALASKKNIETINNDLSANMSASLKSIEVIKPLFILGDTCGDLITLKSGETFLAKVLEVNDSTLKYKKCDNISGPLYSIEKTKVLNVKYTNGILDEFKSERFNDKIVIEVPHTNEITEPLKTLETNAIISLTLSILSFFLLIAFLAFTAILFSWGGSLAAVAVTLVALVILIGILFLALALAKKGDKKIKAQPTLYEGEGVILASRIISRILLGVYLLMVAFALFLLFIYFF